MGDVQTGPGWCRAERIALLSQVANQRGALVVCGAPRELGTANLWVRDALVIAQRRGWVQTTAYEKEARVGRPMIGWAPRRWVINGADERAALAAAIAKNPAAQQLLAVKRPVVDHIDNHAPVVDESTSDNNATPSGVEGDTMIDVKKMAADAAAAREKINQGIAERRQSGATPLEAIADEVYAQHVRGVRWADTVAHFGCSSSVYYSARKLGKERAEAAAEAARKAEAEAEAEAARKAEAEAEAERKAAARKAAADAAAEVRALSLRLAAEADAAIAAEAQAKRKAANEAEAQANTPVDDKKVMREAADAMAQIIESSLVAHGIKVVGRVNRAVNTAMSKNRSTSPGRPIFVFELRTDWRLADGVVTPTAASAAPVDEIVKLQAGCDGLRAVLAMAQMQLESMKAAKAGKP
jgi:hypothetical protein